jgi:hypothetical protein
MDQLIPLHKSNKKSEEWEDDGLAHSLNQTVYQWIQIWWSQRVWANRFSKSGAHIELHQICPHTLPKTLKGNVALYDTFKNTSLIFYSDRFFKKTYH